MNLYYKIFWEDGMQLYPHHFQQQDLYLESLIKKCIVQKENFWGIQELYIDEDILRDRKHLTISHCSGILPDGTTFNTNFNTGKVSIVDLNGVDFERLNIYIGIKNTHIAQHTPTKDSRYLATKASVEDYTSHEGHGSSVIDIQVCKLNLQILVEGKQDLDDYCHMPIARLYQKKSIIYIDKQTYIAPCIDIKYSAILVSYLELLVKDIKLYLSSYQAIDIQDSKAGTWQLILRSIMNNYKYIFTHFLHHRTTPYKLYTSLINFLSQITIFADQNLDEFLDQYDQKDIYKSLKKLISLSTLLFKYFNKETNIQIDFTQQDGIFVAYFSVTHPENYDFIIQIEPDVNHASQTSDLKLIYNSIKVAEVDQIKKVIFSQVSGTKLSLVEKGQIKNLLHNENYIYLKLEPEGNLWQEIQINKNIAIYCPNIILNIKKAVLWIIKK